MIQKLFIFALILASDFDVGFAYSANDLKTLLTTIFTGYDTRIRPVYTDQSNAVDVTMDLYIVGVNNFDSSTQKLTTTAYLEIGKHFLICFPMDYIENNTLCFHDMKNLSRRLG